jgi:cyclic pyranopterin phosphate synthase
MPAHKILQKAPYEVLTFEEITKVAELAIGIGINRIKITGGEPLVRRNLTHLLESLFSLPGLIDLSLTTNGVLLQKYARELREVGLKRLNISTDTLNSQMFKRITKFGNLTDILRGIDVAIKEGFSIKLNVVVMKGFNASEVVNFVRFAQEREMVVRFIELMPMANNIALEQSLFMSCEEVKDRLRPLGELKQISGVGFGNGPAQYYKIEGTSAIVGFISPLSSKFCFNCNRLRLTCDGLLRPCLSSRTALDLRRPLRENKEEEVLFLIRKAIQLKPQGHDFIPAEQADNLNKDSLAWAAFTHQRTCLMSQIGG